MLLQRLDGGEDAHAAIARTEQALQTASPDELYEFIDKQLGSA
jgi:hypothetical protein